MRALGSGSAGRRARRFDFISVVELSVPCRSALPRVAVFDDAGNPVVPLIQPVRHGVLVLQFAIPVTGFALVGG